MPTDESSRDQLTREISELSWRLRALEAELVRLEIGEQSAAPDSGDRRSSSRLRVHDHVEFVADFDILEAKDLDIAKAGLSFKLFEPLRVHVRVGSKGIREEHSGHLVWAGRDDHGQLRLAIEFSDDESTTLSSF